MPDYNFGQNSHERLDEAANISTPQWEIEATLRDGETVVNDFTGANKIKFPQCLSTISETAANEIVAGIVSQLIYAKAGFPPSGP